MNYYKCYDCWRVYDQWQLTDGPYTACICGSHKFKSFKNMILRRLFTDFKYTVKSLIKERLINEKTS